MNMRTATLLVTLCMPVSLLAANIDGRVDWAERVTLSTPVTGIIAEINAQPGQQVTKGDLLLKLVETDFKARIRRAKAKTNKTRHVLAEAEREWERGQELYERTVTSDREFKLSEIAYQAALADYNAARAELTLANTALAKSMIKAPFNGIIIARHVSVAETVVTKQQNVPMITMGMTGRYYAVASVDADTAAKLKNGMAVRVETNSKEHDGKIVFVAVEPENGSYTVKADFETTDILRIGTSATIVTP